MDFSHPEYGDLLTEAPRICFIGHPQAGGMALTLTAAPTMIFFSNSFSGEDRIQSEGRFHRAGMDVNRSAKIIDLMHLPTDHLVLTNLQKKRKLQSLTLGEVLGAINGQVAQSPLD